VRLVDHLIAEAARLGASDMHFEPHADALAVRLRVDGVLRPAWRLPASIRTALVSRLKVMAGMDISVRLRPQDGGLRVDLEDRSLSLRISTLPTGIAGEKTVVRLLDPERAPTTLEDLGLSAEDAARLREVVAAGAGVVLATGPTGSGKSSTLHALLHAVDRAGRNVVTLEDPVEYPLPGVTQVQIASRAGLGFPAALRAVLRQDPDTIMVGEIRDAETASIAMAAAVTGHLVLSTLHTTDAPGALARLVHMGVPPYLVAGGVSAVVAQRLARRVCGSCGGRAGNSRAPGACRRCEGRGLEGRIGIFQLLVMDDALRDAVVDGASTPALRRLARDAGMGSLADDARRKVAEGRTTSHEIASIVRADPTGGRRCPSCDRGVPVDAIGCPWCGCTIRRVCRCGTALEPGWRWCPACRDRRGSAV
jgi:type II secretory ATPase GspE/PulE/Tfp pilus assembly ATPase PilB-like protein